MRWKSAAAMTLAGSIIAAVSVAADDKPAPAPTAAPSAAPSPAPSPETSPPGPAPVEITSFDDTYYSYNFNNPPGDTPPRNFDTKHNPLSIDLVEVAPDQKPTAT